MITLKHVNFNNTPDSELPRPKMADGTLIPDGVAYQMFIEAREKELRKESRRHDYMVAGFSAAIGGLFGFAASLLYDFITSL